MASEPEPITAVPQSQAKKTAVHFADEGPREISPLVAPDAAEDWSTGSRRGAEHRIGAQQALQHLLEGNKRFLKGDFQRCKPDLELLKDLQDGQAPSAVVLACSDSRVPPELVLDQGLGDIFSVRVTGNCVNDFVMGSILNAVQRLGPRLVLVMGHTRCPIVARAVHAWAKEQTKGPATAAAQAAHAAPASAKPKLQSLNEHTLFEGQAGQAVPTSPFQKASQESNAHAATPTRAPALRGGGGTRGGGGGFLSKMYCCGASPPAEATAAQAPQAPQANGTAIQDRSHAHSEPERSAPHQNMERVSVNPVSALVGAINTAVVAVANNDKLKHVLSHVHRADEGDIGLQSKDSLGLTRARLARERDHTKPDLYNNICAMQGIGDVISEHVRLSAAAVLKGLLKGLDPSIAAECEVVASVFDMDTGRLEVLKRGWISGRSIYYDDAARA